MGTHQPTNRPSEPIYTYLCISSAARGSRPKCGWASSCCATSGYPAAPSPRRSCRRPRASRTGASGAGRRRLCWRPVSRALCGGGRASSVFHPSIISNQPCPLFKIRKHRVGPIHTCTAGGAEALLAAGPLTRRTRQQLNLDADDLEMAVGGGGGGVSFPLCFVLCCVGRDVVGVDVGRGWVVSMCRVWSDRSN